MTPKRLWNGSIKLRYPLQGITAGNNIQVNRYGNGTRRHTELTICDNEPCLDGTYHAHCDHVYLPKRAHEPVCRIEYKVHIKALTVDGPYNADCTLRKTTMNSIIFSSVVISFGFVIWFVAIVVIYVYHRYCSSYKKFK